MLRFVIKNRVLGKLNATTGKTMSFNQIAKIIQYSVKKKFNLIYVKRNGPMPHRGYRAFDISKIKKICHNLVIKKISKSFFKRLIKNYH